MQVLTIRHHMHTDQSSVHESVGPLTQQQQYGSQDPQDAWKAHTGLSEEGTLDISPGAVAHCGRKRAVLLQALVVRHPQNHCVVPLCQRGGQGQHDARLSNETNKVFLISGRVGNVVETHQHSLYYYILVLFVELARLDHS